MGKQGERVPPTHFEPGQDQKLVDACLGANVNFIRVMDKPTWNMCTNIEWQSCLVQGKLPGQQGNEAMFARAPKSLTMHELRHPPDPCTGDCNWGLAPSDIYFWETCFF